MTSYEYLVTWIWSNEPAVIARKRLSGWGMTTTLSSDAPMDEKEVKRELELKEDDYGRGPGLTVLDVVETKVVREELRRW